MYSNYMRYLGKVSTAKQFSKYEFYYYSICLHFKY